MSAFRAALVALGATVLTAACAAGQRAQTAEEKTTIDGTQGQVGKIQLEGVAFQAPKGASYAKGTAVPLSVYIVNNGQTPDSLTKVSGTGFTGGWNAVSTASVGSGSGSSAGSVANGRPQQIGAGSAVGFGLQNLSASGGTSSKTIVLYGNPDALFPGTAVKVTFTFAQAGETTLTVPVQISTTPNDATLPGGSASAAG